MAAASELVADLLLNWKGTTLSKEAARNLYIALVGDSGRLQYSSTPAHTFAIADALIQTGISINEIYLKISSEQGKDNVNLFANIAGINAWCSITEDPNPKDYCWRVSIRSKKVDISPIAMKWGGGGHAQASGAKIKDLTELDAFIGDLDKLFA